MDILVYGKRAVILLRLVMQSKVFTGIGLNQTGNINARFIHIDNLGNEETTGNRPWIWTY